MNLAKALVERGHRVTIWSTDFYHQEKRHRFGRDSVIDVSEALQVRLIHSCGYRRNIGISRFVDHAQLGLRFRRLAGKAPLPDIAVVGFPPIEIAAAAVGFCRRHGVPSVLDVKDLWPDLFEDPAPAPARPAIRTLLAPLHRLAVRAIRNSDAVCAPSLGFMNWARAKAGISPRPDDFVAPLTSPRYLIGEAELCEAGTWWDSMGVPADGRPRAAFVGSMSRSFDFDTMLSSARSPAGARWQWVVCGEGEELARCKLQVNGLPNVVFPGWIDRPKIQALLSRSTVGLAPYRSIPNFELNICNKVYDYLEAGLPVVSPLRGDLLELLAREGVGRSHAPGDANALISAMETVLPAEARAAMGAAAARLHGTRFEAGLAYARLAERLETLAMSRAKAASPPDSAHA
jgi:glycosyltransferase involved in cell wall biosynthesis